MKRIIDVLEAHRRFHSKAGCPGQEDCYVCAEEQWAELHNGLPDGETLDRTRPFESRKLTPTEHTEARIANVANDNSQYEDCEADE